MNLKAAMTIVALLLASILPAAAEEPPLTKDFPIPSAWSAQDYATAKPMPLPRVSLESQQQERFLTSASQGPVVYRNSKSPVGAAQRDRHKTLFDPEEWLVSTQTQQSVTPQAYGTAGLIYSSSRVAPRATAVQWPWRMIGKLFFEKSDGTYICSAAVIDKRLVLTAGHCVHDGMNGSSGFFSGFRFVPAYRDGDAKFGEWFVRSVIVSGGWANSGDIVPAYDDYAIFEMYDDLYDDRIGDVVGRLGWQTNSLCPNHLTLLGYPANLDSGTLMHQVNTGDCYDSSSNTVRAGSDMRGGSSGGPWVQNFGVRSDGQTYGSNKGGNRAVGVTSYGPIDPDVLFQGSSVLDDTFVSMRDNRCALALGNC